MNQWTEDDMPDHSGIPEPIRKNEIWKIYGTDYKEITRRLLGEAGLSNIIGDKSLRIGIKPNLVSPSTADWGATTHPELVAGIIEYLQEKGFKNLTILESSWVGDKTSDAMEVCGYNALCEKYGVPFVDIQKDGHHRVDASGIQMEICDAIANIDFLINVPVLKGHCQTKITCALKNIKGLVPSVEKRHFHKLGLHEPIAHLNAAIRQDFIVVDHICGDLDFEDGGNPVIRNCVMAAMDPVLVDSYVCKLLHYTADDVPYIRIAEKLGVGSADLTNLRIRTLGKDGSKEEDEELPRPKKVVAVMDAVQEVESCSACYGYLLPALDQLREEGLLEELLAVLPDKICIGQGYRGQTGKIGVGNCTKDFDFHIKGCPPVESQIYEGLKRYLTMNNNKPKYDLIAFDMDGTLLDSTKKIRPDSLAAIHRAVEAGKVVSLSTGRCLPELRAFEDQMTDVGYYICMSGALVYSNKEKKEIISSPIPADLVQELLDRTADLQVMIHLLSWESIVEKDKVENIEQYHMAPYKASYEECCIIPEDLRAWYKDNPCPVFKLNFYCRDLEQRAQIEARLAGLELEFAYSEETNLECSPIGVSKAKGLRRLCTHLGLSVEHTIAVGDADNDLAILKAAGLSVAMGNAAPHIKEIADVVTASCDEGGCAQVIEEYLL